MNPLAQKLAPFGEALRRDAETRVQAQPRASTPATVEELQFAVEELHIYEAELEIQNEELIESRAQIEQSHQKYFRHFDLAPVGLIRVNGAGLVVESNILGAQMLSVNRAQFYLGKRPFLAHVAAESHGAFQQHFETAFSTGILESCDLTLRNANGTETFVRMQSVRSRGESNAAELYVTLTDLTDRRLIERELASQKLVAEAATHAAEAAKVAKEEFFTMLAHELQTPLTPVLALIGELQATPGRGAADGTALATMRRNLDLESRLVDDLLDLTRINSGRLALQRERTDVHFCLGQAVEDCRPELEEKELFFEFDPGAARHFAEADGKRLQQIFRNVLANAIKFTPAGGRIAVRTRNAAEHLVIEFQDTGRGIENAALDRIFDPFMQVDAPGSRDHRGLGLGLAIARVIAESHGGRLLVSSAGAGHGATFRFELPIHNQSVSDELPPASGAALAAPRKSLRLLVVDDHDDTRETLQRLLKRRGYAVESARDAAGARTLCAAQVFDLLITDLGLPDVGGGELFHELSHDYHLRGIAVSGFGTDKDHAGSKAAGFLDHLVKPLDLQELDAAIQRSAAKDAATPPSQSVGNAFVTLVEEHFPAAYRFAFCLSLSPHCAAELTEAVFTEARQPSETGANSDQHRRTLLKALHRDWAAQGSRETPLQTKGDAPGSLRKVAGNAAQRDAAAAVTILHRMPAEARLVLGLFYFEQLGYADIALILDLPNETVIALLAAAKTALRRQLEEERNSSSVLFMTPNCEPGE